MNNRYEKFRTREVISNMEFDKKIQKLHEEKSRIKPLKQGELTHKDELESAGRLSYFTEVFEGISLEEQKIEVEGFPNPTESLFFQKGREIAGRLVRNNVATMENYGGFCKVETGKVRNGR